jgi:hypothetical protein
MWEHQWYDLRSNRDTLARYCAGEPMDNQIAAQAFRAACLAAWALAEHLQDEAAAARTFRDRDQALKDTSDVTNTWKHAGRDKGRREGHLVRDVELPGGLHRLDVQFMAQGKDAEPKDALEIVDSALDAWAGYLRDRDFTVEWPEA